MKKNIAKIALIIAAALILHRIDAFDALLAFFLTGAIPGTTFNIPSLPMLLLTTGMLYFVILRIPFLKVLHSKATDKLVALHEKITLVKFRDFHKF